MDSLLKTDSPKLFDTLAKRYDSLNRLLSLGMDNGWRQSVVRYLPDGEGLKVLDVGTGTAHVAISLLKGSSRIASIVGIDLSREMLKVGHERIEDAGLSAKIVLEVADVQKLPFAEGAFDAVTAGFVMRNVPDLMAALAESYRVLGPKGRMIILEFSRPEALVPALLHIFYLKCIIPLLILVFHGDIKAYQYLVRTVMTFPSGDRFVRVIRQVGFKDSVRHELLFGAITIYVAEK